jgi:hypothetical protein
MLDGSLTYPSLARALARIPAKTYNARMAMRLVLMLAAFL